MRGRWFIAPHAVRRFIERAWPGATYAEALERQRSAHAVQLARGIAEKK